MKRKGGQLLIGVLAALAFILVIYYANHDRPVYKEGDTSGTSYEIGKVVGILEDNVTVDESTDGLWRGDMKLQVKILTGAYKGETAEVTNYFSSLYNVRVSQGDKVSIRIDTDDDGGYQVSDYSSDCNFYLTVNCHWRKKGSKISGWYYIHDGVYYMDFTAAYNERIFGTPCNNCSHSDL